jgi:uncharacterized membrane protein (DUF106 family)
MNATWITLTVVAIVGITKLLTYLLGKPRKIEKLKEKERAILEEMREVAYRSDGLRISHLERELKLLRETLARFSAK